MIAAIYARKSTRQEGVADEAKSVTRQVDNARAFVAKKGWTTDDAYVFEDDGKSGAEFERRPGLQRLLSALKPKPPFNVLVVSEQKSLGREQFDTGQCDARAAVIPTARDTDSRLLSSPVRSSSGAPACKGSWPQSPRV